MADQRIQKALIFFLEGRHLLFEVSLLLGKFVLKLVALNNFALSLFFKSLGSL